MVFELNFPFQAAFLGWVTRSCCESVQETGKTMKPEIALGSDDFGGHRKLGSDLGVGCEVIAERNTGAASHLRWGTRIQVLG